MLSLLIVCCVLSRNEVSYEIGSVHFIHERTYSMEKRLSWEGNRFLASQEIPRILRKPTIHYSTHKSQPPVPAMTPIQSMPSPPIPLPEDQT